MRTEASKESGLKEKILDLRDKGFTYRQIEKKLGCSKSVISYHCNPDQKKKVWDRLSKWRERNPAKYQAQKDEEVSKRVYS